MHRDVKMLVVACNSVEVSAIGDIAERAGIPVVGVIDPGTRAAAHATRNRVVGMIGTQATVASGAYDRAMAAAGPGVELHRQACPVFVEHVERGDTTSPELREAARGYLGPLVDEGIDTLILGCTHYPLLSGLLQLELGPDVVLVSSAEETAKDVYATLLRPRAPARRDRRRPGTSSSPPAIPPRSSGSPSVFLGPELGEVGAAQAQPVGGGSWS